MSAAYAVFTWVVCAEFGGKTALLKVHLARSLYPFGTDGGHEMGIMRKVRPVGGPPDEVADDSAPFMVRLGGIDELVHGQADDGHMDFQNTYWVTGSG